MIVEAIPYKSFKEKIRLTKKYLKKRYRIEDLDGVLYLERR